MKQWDVYWAYVKFDDKDKGKGRPVVIAEDNPENNEPIICYKCTTTLKTKGSYHIEKWELAGLEKRTAVILNKTVALSIEDFENRKKKGRLRFCDIQKINKKLDELKNNQVDQGETNMNSQIEKIKAFIKDHDNKKNRIVAGGVCAVLVLGLVGVGVGLNMANGANLDPAKALTQAEDSNSDNKADENAENSENNAEQSESATEATDGVTVNESGEVVDGSGNVIAESVEAYNATPQAKSRPVNATSGNTPSTPSSQLSGSGSSQPSHVHTWATRTVKEATSEPIKEYKCVNSYYQCRKCGTKNPTRDHMFECNGSYELMEDWDWVVTGYKNTPAVTETYCSSCGAIA